MWNNIFMYQNRLLCKCHNNCPNLRLFSGFLRDVSGSYSIPLYTTTAALMAGLVLCTISLVLHRDVKAQEKRERSVSVFTVTRF